MRSRLIDRAAGVRSPVATLRQRLSHRRHRSRCAERHCPLFKRDYLLTAVYENHRLGPSRYPLVTSQDLSQHVGERVEIRGNAVTHGDGTVMVESETKTEGTTGAFDVPYLGVRSIKMRSSSCTR